MNMRSKDARLGGRNDDTERLKALCLYLADWGGYWNSGCADLGILEQLRQLRAEAGK